VQVATSRRVRVAILVRELTEIIVAHATLEDWVSQRERILEELPRVVAIDGESLTDGHRSGPREGGGVVAGERGCAYRAREPALQVQQ
jgi:hypothetical protein